MDGDDEEATKKVVRRSRPAEPRRSRAAAPAQTSGPPVYGTPPGTDPTLPVYGSRDSAKPIEPARQDFDPRAEEKAAAAKAAAAAAQAAAAARQARAAEVAQAAKVRAKERAAQKAAKKEAARAAYIAKKERTARIAEETRWARFERNGNRGNRNYARVRQRMIDRRPPRPRAPGVNRPVERARKYATARNLMLATLLIAAAIFIPIIVTNSSTSSPSTVSDGVDWTGYPGQYDGDAQKTLAAPRQEEAIAENTALLAELRAAVEDEIAVSWIEHGSATERPLENRWGGPSLLNEWQSPRWYTTETISGQKLKQRLVDRVSGVLSEHGFEDPRLVNDPDTSFYSPRSIERLYGGSKLDTQVVWELKATSIEDEYVDFTFTITDFSKDKTGRFATDAERDAEYLDTPVSSMAMTLTSRGLLAASDAPEFRDRAAPFEGKEPPKR